MRNILVTISGPRPGLVTSALYAAVVLRRFVPDEIIVITTPSAVGKLTPGLAGHITDCAKQWNCTPPRFDERQSMVIAPDWAADQRAPIDEEMLFADAVTDTIRQLTERKDSALLVSIAGGRKTMSVAAAFAMSLFARPQDDMFHVVVSDHLERSGILYPRTPDEAAGYAVASVPFIRLRTKLDAVGFHAPHKFTDMVAAAQGEVDNLVAVPPLIVDCENRMLRIGATDVPLQPKLFACYRFFAEAGQPVPGGYQFSAEHEKQLWSIYLTTAGSAGNIERAQKKHKTTKIEDGKKFTWNEDVQKLVSQINRAIKTALNDDALAEHYCVAPVKKLYGAKRYAIPLRKEKIIIKQQREQL